MRKGKTLKNLFLITVIVICGCARADLKIAVHQPQAIQPLEDMEILRVYFPFASDYIVPETDNGIRQNIEWMNKNPETFVILEGHCDEVGPKDFNMELGDRRARAVKAHMIGNGIPAERIIMVVSYGSMRPLNPGHTIEDLRQNRRVEFVLR